MKNSYDLFSCMIVSIIRQAKYRLVSNLKVPTLGGLNWNLKNSSGLIHDETNLSEFSRLFKQTQLPRLHPVNHPPTRPKQIQRTNLLSRK